jgi:hypothetical protein
MVDGVEVRIPNHASVTNEHVILDGDGLCAEQGGIGNPHVVAKLQSRSCFDDELRFACSTDGIVTLEPMANSPFWLTHKEPRIVKDDPFDALRSIQKFHRE